MRNNKNLVFKLIALTGIIVSLGLISWAIFEYQLKSLDFLKTFGSQQGVPVEAFILDLAVGIFYLLFSMYVLKCAFRKDDESI